MCVKNSKIAEIMHYASYQNNLKHFRIFDEEALKLSNWWESQRQIKII